ncbi:MAG: AAA family ATPase [Treponema sp.]|nr:AAA family ATPase [Treponema sp.]
MHDFIGLREDGYCYVDKTIRIYELINSSGRAFFLFRPRRFGKSLLRSTLGAVFEGSVRRDERSACARHQQPLSYQRRRTARCW